VDIWESTGIVLLRDLFRGRRIAASVAAELYSIGREARTTCARA